MRNLIAITWSIVASSLNKIKSKAFFDLAGDDVVIIVGSGRSGTSWLANICNYRNSFRYLFEPLNPAHLTVHKESPFWCLQNEYAYPLLDRVMRGKVRGTWVDSRNRSVFAKRRLIKEIRANMLVPWISSNFPKALIVLLLRNPLSVAASRKTLSDQRYGNWSWEPNLEELLKTPCIVEKLSNSEFALLRQQIGSGIVMESIADWCINNLVATRNECFKKAHVIFYEDLIVKQDEVVKDLLSHIGVEWNSDVNLAIKKTSEPSRRKVDIKDMNPQSVLNDWQHHITPEERDQALELLRAFDVSRLYTDDWLPISPTQERR